MRVRIHIHIKFRTQKVCHFSALQLNIRNHVTMIDERKITMIVILIVFCTFLKCSNSSGMFSLDENLENKNSNFQFNKTAFVDILKKVDYINLHLRHISEATSNLVDFLIKQILCPIRLTVSPNLRSHVFGDEQRHRAVTISSEADLEEAVRNYGTRNGILMCILLQKIPEDIILNLARKMWHQKGVHKIYYIIQNYTIFYNPFAHRHNTEYGALIDINIMSIENSLINLNGYSLRVYIFDSVYSSVFGDPKTKRITYSKGADSIVAKLLSRKMNFTLSLQWPDDEFFGAHLENGSYNGAIGRMIRYETDITLTGFFIKDYLTREVEFTVSVYMDELCCYVQKAKRIPQSIVPLFAVDADMWFGFILAGMFCSGVWIGIRRVNNSLRTKPLVRPRKDYFATNSQYMRIFIDTWVVWVRVNIVSFPPFHAERVFVVSLCLVSVIFGALFESSLATVFIRPLYYKDINTMQELNDEHFRIYIKHAAMKDDLFYGHSSAIYKNLNKKLLLVGETEDRLIEMMSKRGGFAAVTRASSLVLDDIRYFITQKIHKIPECPKNYHIAFVTPKQSPYGKRINALLLRFVQAGLINQWIEAMKHRSRLSIYHYPMTDMGHIVKMLTLNDLQLAFYVLIMGCLLSTLAWLGEAITRYNFQKWAHKMVNYCLRFKRF